MADLWLEVAVHDAARVHVVDSGDELTHDVTGACLRETRLFADPLQQFSPTQQLRHDVRVQLKQQRASNNTGPTRDVDGWTWRKMDPLSTCRFGRNRLYHGDVLENDNAIFNFVVA